MPPITPRVTTPRTGSPNSFGRLFTVEFTGFLLGRLGEKIVQKANPKVVEQAIALLPDGVLDTPDKQKNFAMFAAMVAAGVSRDAAAFPAFEKFAIEVLEELGNRRGEFVGSEAKRKALLLEAFNKHASPLDALRAHASAAPIVGMNLPTAVALMPANQQEKWFIWLAKQSNDLRALERDHGYGISTTPEHVISVLNAPESIRLEQFKNLLLKSPKLAAKKSFVDKVLDTISEKTEHWVDPDGQKMTDFVKMLEKKSEKAKKNLELLKSIF